MTNKTTVGNTIAMQRKENTAMIAFEGSKESSWPDDKKLYQIINATNAGTEIRNFAICSLYDVRTDR